MKTIDIKLSLLVILIQFVSPFVKAQPSNPFGNALIPDMIADASIQEIEGTFYCHACRVFGNRLALGTRFVWV